MVKIAFCITGWHFPVKFFDTVKSLPSVDIFIISHKKKSQIPDYVIDLIPEERLLIRPNLGYDWGCYQQFLASGLWQNYEIIFFMHDDIEIHDLGFVDKSLRLLKDHAVIGNGVGAGSVSNSRVNEHPYAYAHSRWKPDTYTFQHHTVRGSFFATTRQVLERIGKFEVHWDLFALNIGFGNWSTKASCGKLESIYGQSCFGFLSSTFGRSEFITEFIRGDQDGIVTTTDGFRKDLYAFLKRISTIYMEIYFRERTTRFHLLWKGALRLFLGLFSGRF